MKEVIKYLCALTLIVMVSATTVSVMTVKPATPKMVLVEYFQEDYSKAKNYILDGYRRGYVLKSVDRMGGEITGHYVIVMEKY